MSSGKNEVLLDSATVTCQGKLSCKTYRSLMNAEFCRTHITLVTPMRKQWRWPTADPLMSSSENNANAVSGSLLKKLYWRLTIIDNLVVGWWISHWYTERYLIAHIDTTKDNLRGEAKCRRNRCHYEPHKDRKREVYIWRWKIRWRRHHEWLVVLVVTRR